MNDLVPFSFESSPIRVVDQNGEPWFVASDICAVLDIANVGSALSRLRDNERGTVRNADVTSSGGNPNLAVINESGMWKLVLRSRKAEAERLITWLTSQVLPSLRRTGQYGKPALAIDVHDPNFMLALVQQLADTRMQDAERIAQLAPKADALAQIADAAGSLCVTDAAKAIGVAPGRLFSWLHANRWIYRRAETQRWVAHQPKLDNGMLEHKGALIPIRGGGPDKLVENVMVTPKGLARLAELKAAR